MDNSFEKLENVIDPVEADHIYPNNADKKYCDSPLPNQSIGEY